MDPERHLAQLVHHARQPLDDAGQLGVELAELGRHGRLSRAQLERERDELLLRAVVQVALDPLPCRIGGGHDPRARSGELRSALGIRDRGRHELGELGEPGLGLSGQRLRLTRRGGHQPPQRSVDDDRHAHGPADVR